MRFKMDFAAESYTERKEKKKKSRIEKVSGKLRGDDGVDAILARGFRCSGYEGRSRTKRQYSFL